MVLCIESAVLSNELDYFWPCGRIFIKVSKLWAMFWTETLYMCSSSVSGFTLGKWIGERNNWMVHLPARQVNLPRIQRRSLPPKMPKNCAFYTVHILNNSCYATYFTTLALADWSQGPFQTPYLSQCCPTPGLLSNFTPLKTGIVCLGLKRFFSNHFCPGHHSSTCHHSST